MGNTHASSTKAEQFQNHASVLANVSVKDLQGVWLLQRANDMMPCLPNNTSDVSMFVSHNSIVLSGTCTELDTGIRKFTCEEVAFRWDSGANHAEDFAHVDIPIDAPKMRLLNSLTHTNREVLVLLAFEPNKFLILAAAGSNARFCFVRESYVLSVCAAASCGKFFSDCSDSS